MSSPLHVVLMVMSYLVPTTSASVEVFVIACRCWYDEYSTIWWLWYLVQNHHIHYPWC